MFFCPLRNCPYYVRNFPILGTRKKKKRGRRRRCCNTPSSLTMASAFVSWTRKRRKRSSLIPLVRSAIVAALDALDVESTRQFASQPSFRMPSLPMILHTPVYTCTPLHASTSVCAMPCQRLQRIGCAEPRCARVLPTTRSLAVTTASLFFFHLFFFAALFAQPTLQFAASAPQLTETPACRLRLHDEG